MVQLWSFNGVELHSSFSIKLAVTVPRGIAFAEGPGSNLYVFGVYNGYWYGATTLRSTRLTCGKACSPRDGWQSHGIERP